MRLPRILNQCHPLLAAIQKAAEAGANARLKFGNLGVFAPLREVLPPPYFPFIAASMLAIFFRA